jgi:TolB-like protein/lipoprotein NlpI
VVIVGLIVLNIIPRTNTSKEAEILDKSIAVLPFISLSDDPEKQYLADGIMDAILLHLSKIEDLRVLARTTSEKYRDTDKTATEICQELGVSFALEGSFRKYGDQARLIVQLIRSGKEDHAWAKQYDREWKEIFAVESEVAQAIAKELQTVITPEEKQRIEKKPTENPEAYNNYLRGMYYFNSHTDFLKSAEYFEKAIQLDSTFALAYSSLAQCYQFMSRYSSISHKDAYSKAKETILKALELDPSLGDAHATRGLIMAVIDWDIYAPEQVFKRAIKLSPGSHEVYSSYAQYLWWLGRYDECISLAKQALELDPLNPTAYLLLAAYYGYSGQFDKSNQLTEKVLNLDPDFILAHMGFALNYILMDMYDKAIAHADKVMSAGSFSDNLLIFSHITWVYAKTGLEDKSRKQLEHMLELSKNQYVDPVFLAISYAGLGENDNAFSCLSEAFEIHSGHMIYLKTYCDLFFKDLCSDPRYDELLRKIGFEVN